MAENARALHGRHVGVLRPRGDKAQYYSPISPGVKQIAGYMIAIAERTIQSDAQRFRSAQIAMGLSVQYCDIYT